ncbi:MAG TPA: hypothetical protein VD947_04145 [Patescibacteria group bacterium]|nr:hypothetical protein [Patescibacteria group bacterium]
MASHPTTPETHEQSSGMTLDTLRKLADGSLIKELGQIGTEVITALDSAVQLTTALQGSNREDIAEALRHLDLSEGELPDLGQLKDSLAVDPDAARTSGLTFAFLRSGSGDNRGIQSFIDARNAKSDTLASRQEQRQQAFDIANTFYGSLTREDWRKCHETTPQGKYRFVYSTKTHTGLGDVTCFPFIEVEPGQFISLRELSSNVDGVDKMGFQLAVKVKDMGLVRSGGWQEIYTDLGIPYATIYDKEDSTITYADDFVNDNAVLADMSDQEVVSKLEIVTQGLREKLDNLENSDKTYF